jgi:hypothetical protein
VSRNIRTWNLGTSEVCGVENEKGVDAVERSQKLMRVSVS